MNGNVVRVVLWGETVGYLTWDSSNWRTTTAVFSFAKDFLDKGIDISPLRMSIASPSIPFGLPAGTSILRGDVPDTLAGLDRMPISTEQELRRAEEFP